MAIVNAYGQALAEYEYDPYGNIVSQSGPLADVNPLRYRGYVYDSETSFYYLQSRYYDPELGRFLNADSYASTGQGVLGNNMFAYCGNKPVICSDHTGKSFSVYIGFNFNLFGWGFTGTVNFVSTDEDYGIQYSYYSSSDAEISEKNNQTIGVDIGPCIGVQYTDKDRMEDLEGYAQATGGDVLLGCDILTDEKGEYLGWQFGASAISLNAHSVYTDTETLVAVRRVKWLDKVVDWLFGG